MVPCTGDFSPRSSRHRPPFLSFKPPVQSHAFPNVISKVPLKPLKDQLSYKLFFQEKPTFYCVLLKFRAPGKTLNRHSTARWSGRRTGPLTRLPEPLQPRAVWGNIAPYPQHQLVGVRGAKFGFLVQSGIFFCIRQCPINSTTRSLSTAGR